MDQDKVIVRLKRQLLIERVVLGALLFGLLINWAFSCLRAGKSIIIVDGKSVACVDTARDARDILDHIRRTSGANPAEIQFRQEILVARAPRNACSVSRSRAMRIVRHVVVPVIPRWAIIADGTPVVGVTSKEVAGEVIEQAKLRFGKLVNNLAEEPQIKENLTIDIAPVSPSACCNDAGQAVKYLFDRGQPIARDATYTVRSGDAAVLISKRVGISLAVLKALNSGLNLEKLQIGDQLRVKKMEQAQAPITVIVRDLIKRTESVSAPIRIVSTNTLFSGKQKEIRAGKPGRRDVEIAVIYENGHKVGSETVSEEILTEPVPRLIAAGIKPRPTW